MVAPHLVAAPWVLRFLRAESFKFVRRAAVVLAAATSAIALSTTSANAHSCFNAHAVQ